MSDWTAGYVADIGYTYGYYQELNPLRAKLALLSAGLACPQIGVACELGFGQGLSVNIHAAASTTEWYGNDFNPSQAAFAQMLATKSGANAHVFDEAFDEFANRQDLPDFDYIGLHGIWSWISVENRAVIVDFIRRKLKVGGVLYISYNTLPGWAAFAPMRNLLTEHARIMGSEGQGITNRINSAIEFSQKLLACNPAFSRNNPTVATRMEKLKDMNRHYLAHEYFNRDWHPMYFSEMAECLKQAKLTYACSAHFLDHVDVINLSGDQQKLLREITNPAFRETMRDYMLNQQFRRDYWVKGPRTLSKPESEHELESMQVMLITPSADVPSKTTAGQGEINLREEIFKPLIELLADHQVRTVGELASNLAARGISRSQVLEILLILSGSNHVALTQPDAVSSKALETSARLNACLLDKARSSNEITYLASPVTGGGVAVSRFQQLFLLGRSTGLKTSKEWAGFAWQVLASQGQKLIKEGKTLQSAEENIAELSQQAEIFDQKMIPLLKKLGIA